MLIFWYQASSQMLHIKSDIVAKVEDGILSFSNIDWAASGGIFFFQTRNMSAARVWLAAQ